MSAGVGGCLLVLLDCCVPSEHQLVLEAGILNSLLIVDMVYTRSLGLLCY